MLGIGIDLVDIDRMKKSLAVDGFAERFFNPAELEDARKKGSEEPFSFAARFAAKEAFGKALGVGLKGIRLTDICVVNNKFGKPELKLFDSALKAFQKIGGEKIHLSLSHEKHIAAAVVAIE